MLTQITRRWLAGIGVAGTFVAASAVPAVAADPLRVLASDILIAPGSSAYQEIAVALAGDEPADRSFRLDLDLSKVDGLITVEPPSDGWDCARTGEQLHCAAQANLPIRPSFPYWVAATAGATPGDSADLPITATYAGRTASRTITVTVAEAVDLQSVREDSAEGEPGAEVALPSVVRNSGPTTAHGAVLVLRPHRLTPYVGNFSNCAYRNGQPAVCRFDTDLEPGRSYRLSEPLPVRLDPHVRSGSVLTNQLDWRTKDDWALVENNPDAPLPPGSPGTGGELRLVEQSVTRSDVPQTDVRWNSSTAFGVRVTGASTADLAAVGSTVAGRVGDKVKVTAGVRNLGPAYVETPPAPKPIVTVHVPAGTTAVAVSDRCAPYSGGKVWDPSDSLGAPGAEQYGCLSTDDLAPGAVAEYAFTLRIDKLDAKTFGVVQARLDGDPDKVNDKAAITVTLGAPGGGGGGGGTLPITGSAAGLIAGVGGLLLVAGVGGLLAARRRRTRFVA